MQSTTTVDFYQIVCKHAIYNQFDIPTNSLQACNLHPSWIYNNNLQAWNIWSMRHSTKYLESIQSTTIEGLVRRHEINFHKNVQNFQRDSKNRIYRIAWIIFISSMVKFLPTTQPTIPTGVSNQKNRPNYGSKFKINIFLGVNMRVTWPQGMNTHWC